MSLSNRKLNHQAYLDAHFNPVAKVCLEIGISLSILDSPGSLGVFIDEYASKLSQIMEAIATTRLGQLKFKLDSKGPNITVKDYFNYKMLQEMHPKSDQIGRCLDASKEKKWFVGEGIRWLESELQRPSTSEKYDYTNLLTKIKAIVVGGAFVRAMMLEHKELLAQLFNKTVSALQERYDQLVTKIIHAEFCSYATRGRREKVPIIEGKALLSYPGLSVQLIDARSKRLGFGEIYHVDGMKETQTSDATHSIIKKYQKLEVEFGRQGMLRLGQDVLDWYRPGLFGESSMSLIPASFENTQLMQELQRHRFSHGSGLNRWEVYGNYAKSAHKENMPVAGGLSGATPNAFLLISCIDKHSIFGTEEAIKLGLLITAFMNFGGYHSFVETFPIAQSIAKNTTFQPLVTAQHRNNLYHEIQKALQKYDEEASKKVVQYYNAYRAC